MRAKLAAHTGLGWDAFTHWGAAVNATSWHDLMVRARDRLLARIAPAVEQPQISPVTEDYTVFRVNQLLDASGGAFPPEDLHDGEISRLLLGERRPLTADARKDLLSPRLAYFEDDLAVLTWSTALVVEPVAGAPRLELLAGKAEDGPTDRRHEAGLLSQWNKPERRNHPVFRMLPAQQRLHAGYLAVGYVDDRLEMQQ